MIKRKLRSLIPLTKAELKEKFPEGFEPEVEFKDIWESGEFSLLLAKLGIDLRTRDECISLFEMGLDEGPAILGLPDFCIMYKNYGEVIGEPYKWFSYSWDLAAIIYALLEKLEEYKDVPAAGHIRVKKPENRLTSARITELFGA